MLPLSSRSALSALFEKHLLRLNAQAVRDYVAMHALGATSPQPQEIAWMADVNAGAARSPAVRDYVATHALGTTNSRLKEIAWTDAEGRTWTLFDRLTWMALHKDISAGAARLWSELAEAEYREEKCHWHLATDAERRRRAEHWLVGQRLGASPWRVPGAAGKVNGTVSSPFRRTFTRQPAGTPASGWGNEGDSGWLAVTLARLSEVQAAGASALGWDEVIAGWFDASLLGRPTSTSGRWWAYGGVSGTRKKQAFPGCPGWEAEGDLPGEPHNSGMHSLVRPAQLVLHWSNLAARIIDLLALAVARAPNVDARQPFPLHATPGVEPWLTPAVKSALGRLAQAGLLRSPAEGPAHARYDGRALQALNLLARTDPDGAWLSPAEKAELAAAVREHQRAWADSPHAYERALCDQSFAPAHAASAWAWADKTHMRPVRAHRP